MEADDHPHAHREAQEAAMAGAEDQQEQHEPGPGEQQHPSPAEAREAAEEGEAEQEVEQEEGEGEGANPRALRPSFPLGRMKKIVKLDREITRVTSEALLLISLSADLFLGFLAEKAGEAAILKRKKSVRVDDIRATARAHHPTRDFLLDSLPPTPARAAPPPEACRAPGAQRPPPPGIRRIDEFFRKSSTAATE